MSAGFTHARGAGVSAVWMEGSGARLVYFGGDLGEGFDVSAISASAPRPLWGARMDEAVLAPASRGPVQFIFDANHGALDISAPEPLTLSLDGQFTRTLSVRGDWANEFRLVENDLNAAAMLTASARGRPGHDAYPGLILTEADCTEAHGHCIALLLVTAGSFHLKAGRMREGAVEVEAHASGESETRVKLVFSAEGLNGLSQRLSAACPAPRSLAPVHLNTWEALYFDHSEEALFDLASKAAALGVERFVLDDGWFKGRKNDTAGLGDWTPDPQKFPNGLMPLARHVQSLGMSFGLWVEPEMVNPDSDLYRAHPDWVLTGADGSRALMRNQLVLDLRQAHVRAHIRAQLDAVLQSAPIAYLKWDMNRDLPAPAPGYAGAVLQMMREISAAHGVEIESCASGGGRADWASLGAAARVWVSDNNDALDRLRINRGASHFMPLRVMGTHIGPEHAHITGRRLSLDLRAQAALFGWLGLELDVRKLGPAESARLAAHIANYKRLRPLIHTGRYMRLPPDDNHLSDMVSGDGHALLRAVRTGSQSLGRSFTVYPQGLNPGTRYRIKALAPLANAVAASLPPAILEGALVLSGQALMARGLELFFRKPETALVLELTALT